MFLFYFLYILVLLEVTRSSVNLSQENIFKFLSAKTELIKDIRSFTNAEKIRLQYLTR